MKYPRMYGRRCGDVYVCVHCSPSFIRLIYNRNNFVGKNELTANFFKDY